MRAVRVCLLVVAVAVAAAVAQDDVIRPSEPLELFNGTDLAGWVPYVRGEADPAATFVWQDGVLAVTGQPAGYLRTAASYADYRLHVEWRWTDKPGNSGVLLHQSGDDKVWPKSIEAQLQSGSAGDFWVIDGTEFKEHLGREGRRTPKQHPSNEKEPGEWNEYDIVCSGNTIAVTVNGLLQNTANECTVSSGRICLQSEGAPIEFRNVRLEPLAQ
jgi:hypothetical protein